MTISCDAREDLITRIRHIRVGTTTRGQVIELLGPLTGGFIYPVARGRGYRGLGYAYTQAEIRRGGTDTHWKSLRVSLDANDVVNDVTFNASR